MCGRPFLSAGAGIFFERGKEKKKGELKVCGGVGGGNKNKKEKRKRDEPIDPHMVPS